jgi:chloramphenicol 3-O-phosphotransferase
MSQIVIVSGPPGSGKSSVCESLCGRYDRTVHLETDQFYAAIRMGFEKPWKPGTTRQNLMVTRSAARAASAYAAELYAVFIDGVVVREDILRVYIDELAPLGMPVHFVTLLPDVETTVRRGLTREATLRVPEDVLRRMHAQFVESGVRAGCTIDNSAMTADEAADGVMSACGRGECLVFSP